MTVTGKRKLMEQQDERMELYRSLEEAQTDFSYDEKFYKAFGRAMQFLDEEVAHKQYLLDTECVCTQVVDESNVILDNYEESIGNVEIQ